MSIAKLAEKLQKQKKIRVAIYARVASNKDSSIRIIDAQAESVAKYVQKHPDLELVDIYSDNGYSGRTTDRPELQRMMQDCRDGKIDLVVTASVTRISRNMDALLEFDRELSRLGIHTYYINQDMHGISQDNAILASLLDTQKAGSSQ